MNREIKFRAWIKQGFDDDVKPFMVKVDSIDWVNCVIQGDIDDNEWMFDDIELMQYTGLKDKKGKEIYEGDIVRTNDKMHTADISKGEVYFSEYGFWAIRDGYEDEVGIELYTYGDGGRKNCGFEVIGNIYEK